MRLMRRRRDGKIASYDLGCVESGLWEEVVENKPEPQKPPAAPRKQAPLKPLVRKTDPEQVVALFAPPTEIPEA
jgi:hypothetical protein